MGPMQIVEREAREHRTVVIRARELDGTVEQREVEPYSLRPTARGPLLHYWCLTKDVHRSVHVPNLLSAAPTGRAFVPRWAVEL